MAAETLLTKMQLKTFRNEFVSERSDERCIIVAKVRHDDNCGNGHNTFSVMADLYAPYRHPNEPKLKTSKGRTVWLCAGGMLHKEVADHFPQLRSFLRWHLCSTDGPLHYVENAMYWAGHRGWCDEGHGNPPNRMSFEDTVVYGAVPEHDEDRDPFPMSASNLEAWLEVRLPALLAVFRKDVEALGFAF